eukprot:5022-Heterococcus_DN1.PRE.2
MAQLLCMPAWRMQELLVTTLCTTVTCSDRLTCMCSCCTCKTSCRGSEAAHALQSSARRSARRHSADQASQTCRMQD